MPLSQVRGGLWSRGRGGGRTPPTPTVLSRIPWREGGPELPGSKGRDAGPTDLGTGIDKHQRNTLPSTPRPSTKTETRVYTVLLGLKHPDPVFRPRTSPL